MTSDRRTKRDVRSRMELTGESYLAARRAVLTPAIGPVPEGLAFLDDRCANCLGPLPEEEAGLFCSLWCHETAKCVRYFRRVFRDGRVRDPNVQDAVKTRLAFLIVGGYDALGRNLSPQTREAVKLRANGLCQTCGAPGVDVDHIAGSSPDLDNLQLLCKSCHQTKTAKSRVPASEEGAALIEQLMADRVLSESPRLLADDDVTWPSTWVPLKAARKQRLLDELVELGVDVRGLRSRAEMVLERDDAIMSDDGYEWERVGEEGGFEFDADELGLSVGDFDGGYSTSSYFARAMSRDD